MARARNGFLVAAIAAVGFACASNDSLTGTAGSGGNAGASGKAGSGGTGVAGSHGSAGTTGAAGTSGGAMGSQGGAGGIVGNGGGGGASACSSSAYPSEVCCRDDITTMTEPFVCAGETWHCESEILASSADACPGGIEGSAGAGGGAMGGVGGAGGASSNPNGVACLPVTTPLITDFTFVPDAGSTSSVHFGDDATTFSGEEYVYPTAGGYPLRSDVTENSWHISGTIGDYSGFGLSFDGCSRLDASAYGGISFTISGVVGMGNMVTMDVGTLDDVVTASWLNAHGGIAAADAPGLCVPTISGSGSYHPGCADPSATIPVIANPTTVSLRWTDFTGGQPESSVNPDGIVAIYWYFPAPVGAGTGSVTTYPVDITIDNLKFTP
jgi:hypothetical protein